MISDAYSVVACAGIGREGEKINLDERDIRIEHMMKNSHPLMKETLIAELCIDDSQT
jgi:hypothetical protein